MSSIVNCIIHTRENLRVIRTSITREVWDVINSAFQEIENFKPSNYRSSKLPNFLRWIIQRTSMLKGAIVSTQLTDDIYDFMNLGYYIERADNTIRILDVKYYILLSKDNKNIENNYQWETLLRSIAAYIQYRRIYGVNVDPRKICHFLIFNKSNPRSLLYCAENINNHVNNLCKYYNQKSCILAVDNVNGMDLLGRILHCDHVDQYKLPKEVQEAEDKATTLNFNVDDDGSLLKEV